jgi:hypothetical protein
VAINRNSIFTIRLSSANQPLSSLSIGGSVGEGKAVVEALRTDFLDSSNVRVLKNFSGNSFDLGFSFDTGSSGTTVLAQLNVKFLERGSFTIKFHTVNGYGKDRRQIQIRSTSATVEVY